MISIRKQLLRWLLVGQLLAIIVTGSISFLYVRSELEDLFDDRLRQLAYSVPVNASALPAPPPRLNNMFEDEDDFVIQIWNGEDGLLLHLNKEEGSPGQTEVGFSTHTSGGTRWRSFVLKRDHLHVQVSQPFDDRLEMSLNISLAATAPILILIVALGGLVWIAVGKSLAPLTAIAVSLDRQGPISLAPLPLDNLPSEILPLAKALNNLLERLGQAMEVQRKFTADAAHELRTPITAVHLQAQLLERCQNSEERAELLAQLRSGIERSGHLVQQLLSLARVEPDKWERPFAKVDLKALLGQVVAGLTPAALHRKIDLGINHSEHLYVFGDVESLRVMFSNLIDNAIRYSNPGGRVDVSLSGEATTNQVVIQDQGPGIPAAERQQVFNRFYRRSQINGSGTGLGLAIVREVVNQHQGTIELQDGENNRGLKVIVSLPPAADNPAQ